MKSANAACKTSGATCPLTLKGMANAVGEGPRKHHEGQTQGRKQHLCEGADIDDAL